MYAYVCIYVYIVHQGMYFDKMIFLIFYNLVD